MNKKWILGIAFSFALIASCTSETTNEETTENNTEEQVEIVEETESESGEESTEVAFMGVEKDGYMLYGHTDFEANESTSIDAMLTEFEEAGSFNGAVEVTINEVCQNAGCWINFQKPDSEEAIMVFFRDHFTIPIETSAGKEAILYGSLNADTLTVDFQTHLLDDAAANGEEVSQAEYDAITEDKIDVTFDCESILIKD